MMGKTVFDVLTEKLNEHKRSAMEVLAEGGCKDFAHYRQLCGLIQGLKVAQIEVNDLMRNSMEDEDD
jgi:hypothetical protein